MATAQPIPPGPPHAIQCHSGFLEHSAVPFLWRASLHASFGRDFRALSLDCAFQWRVVLCDLEVCEQLERGPRTLALSRLPVRTSTPGSTHVSLRMT